MVSIVLTAWKEAKTAGKVVEELLSQVKDLKLDVEFILVCPDEETLRAVEKIIEKHNFENFTYVKDPQKGKPHALNLARKSINGDIIVSTDGDVRIEKKALGKLLEPFSDKDIWGVTGRPTCANDRSTMWGYWGHLFMDAAHKRRTETLGSGEFFVMSGYLLAMREMDWDIPDGMLDDMYFSYGIREKGKKIAYAPEAIVYVKQPTSTSDWVRQKVRNLAGHELIEETYGSEKRVHSISDDLRYSFFLISYARNIRELLWSFIHIPLRIYIWLRVWWLVKVRGMKASEIWLRVESTK